MPPELDSAAAYDVYGGDGGQDGDNWLLSYADLLTTLLAFFVLMFAISTVHTYRFERVSQAFSGDAPPGLADLSRRLEALLDNPELRGSFEAELGDDGLTIRLKEQVLFASARADIAPQGERLVAHVAGILDTLPPPFAVVVEGHADEVPIHTPAFASNWELSASRSINVVKRMIELGVPRERISAQAFADTRPANDNAEDRAKNRRVVVRVR